MLVVIIILAPVMAWSKTGHRVVAQIAQNHLTESALVAVMNLTQGRDLADFSNWADEIKQRKPKTKTAHYIADYDEKTLKEHPSYQALIQHIDQLTGNQDDQKKLESLKWIIHLVADIHQPLHVGNGKDQGGNQCQVYWFGSKYPVKLHYVWDQLLIRQTDYSFSEYARYLNHIDQATIESWGLASIEDWFKESFALHESIYPKQYPRSSYCKGYATESVTSKYPRLYHAYVNDVMPIVNQRLQQAGIRLAQLLERVYVSTNPKVVL